MKRLALAFLVAAAATSCGRSPEPTPIPFASHPSILRGTWEGTLTQEGTVDQSLRLDLAASYETSRQYGVTGTGSLGTEALTVTGSVTGGTLHSYLRAQFTPANQLVPETARLMLRRSGKADLELSCYAIGGDTAPAAWLWQCYSPENPQSFKLSKQTP